MISFFKKHHKKFIVSIVCIVIALSSSIPALAAYEVDFTAAQILTRVEAIVDEPRSSPSDFIQIDMENATNFVKEAEDGTKVTEVWWNYKLHDENVTAFNVRSGGHHNFIWCTNNFLKSFNYNFRDYHFYIDGFDFNLNFDENAYSARIKNNPNDYYFENGQQYTLNIEYLVHDCFGGGVPEYFDIYLWLLLAVPAEENDLGFEYYFVPFSFAFSSPYSVSDGYKHSLTWDFKFNCNYAEHTEFNLSAVFFSYVDPDSFWYPNGTYSPEYQFCLYDFTISEKTLADPLSSTNDAMIFEVDNFVSINDTFISSSIDNISSVFDLDFNSLFAFSNAASVFTTVFNALFISMPDLSVVLSFSILCGAFAVLCGLGVAAGRAISRNSTTNNKPDKKGK